MATTSGIHHPEWVYVNFEPGLPTANRFASCYRCGELCQPDRDNGMAENALELQAFCDTHCACKEARRRG